MLNKLKNMRQGAGEDGFTLIELMIVVLIIGILAAIAIPILLTQQAEATNSSVRSDVRNTVTNVATFLVSEPTAASITPGTLEEVEAGTADVVAVVSNDNTVEITGGYNDYTVVGNNAGTGFTFTFDSTDGTYTD